MTEVRRPLHLPVVIGISAGVYAISLAGVTGLQSGHDVALAAAHQPATQAVALLRGAHDDLDAQLARARAAYGAAAGRYGSLAAGLGSLDTRLADVAGQVEKVRRTPLGLPGAGQSGMRAGSTIIVVRPGAAAPIPVAPAAPAAPPPVHATTGASGAPPP